MGGGGGGGGGGAKGGMGGWEVGTGETESSERVGMGRAVARCSADLLLSRRALASVSFCAAFFFLSHRPACIFCKTM